MERIHFVLVIAKVLSKFDFGHFLEKWLQRHLVTLHWMKNFWCGTYQYMFLVSKLGSKSVEEFVSRFCFVQISREEYSTFTQLYCAPGLLSVNSIKSCNSSRDWAWSGPDGRDWPACTHRCFHPFHQGNSQNSQIPIQSKPTRWQFGEPYWACRCQQSRSKQTVKVFCCIALSNLLPTITFSFQKRYSNLLTLLPLEGYTAMDIRLRTVTK